MPLPKLTEEQRQDALKKAAEARQKRAELRKQLKNGDVNVKDIISKTDDPIVSRMKVSSLLESLPGIGKARAQKIMQEAGISPTRRVQGLGSKQKEILITSVGK
ncbi:MAG: integration host factor [Candidatus Aquicultor primus]|jgi:DNA uptake protein ComE-like DNA-binding protein|uniref:Integration host factor n=1 Tax=Candidatus Aquicultor primus TaxID=1797195 RepID=A0A1F2UUC5_9ACTN|nr:MAG: integration host factor [Candidatus Aquicultor primus]HCG99227.1 integration host factor [Actinomycetota bacterium]